MNKLTIDEIIEHCKRKTARYEHLNGVKELENADISNNFIKEYWEHRQVAGYLEELQQYRAIGTVEECREARERQRGKKPVIGNDNGRPRKCCSVCGCFYSPTSKYCPKCGQGISREGE